MSGLAQWSQRSQWSQWSQWWCRVWAVLLAACAANAAAQTAGYPNKPVRIVIAYPAGGGSDFTARPIAARLTEKWGQSVVVDSRGGGSGMIGTDIVAKSAPDGYTLLLSASSEVSMNVALFGSMPYDPVKQLAPISLLTTTPPILMAHPSVPVHNMKELIALAKARPGQISYASVGIATPQHFAGEWLRLETKIDWIHVPYKGAAPALIDLLGGHVPVGMVALVVSMPHIKSGKLRPIAVTTAKRTSVLPNVPSIGETVPGFDIGQWFAMWAPAGTPPELVQKLNAEIVAIVRSPDYTRLMFENGTEMVGSSPEELRKLQVGEIEKYRRLAAQLNIRAE